MAKAKKEKGETKKCDGCSKDLVLGNFYQTKSPLSKDGKMNICKKCLNKMIDVDNIETVYKVLQMMDLPFFYDSWERAKRTKPNNPWAAYIVWANTGFNEFNGATYRDSEFIKKQENTESINIDHDVNEKCDTKLVYSSFWRGSYTQEDLDYLDNYLKQLKDDFKIITINHKDYAKKIAKTSLLMDKAYEDILNGVSGAEKRYNDLQKTFDTLSKSAQFSENTRGANDVSLGGFGVVFDKVEQRTWIPKHVPLEKDDYDKLIDAFSTINKSV